MTLILTVISYKGAPPPYEISARFDRQQGTIGRAPDNQMVLPDPDKFVSRLHATIVYEGGQYYIKDSSAGGTYLVRKDIQLQQHQASLENGEVLRLGEYEVLVTIADDTPASFAPAPMPEPVRQLELAESDLLGGPFAAQGKPDSPDFYSSFVEQAESSVFHQSFTPPSVGETPKTDAGDLDFGDLLSTLENLPGANTAPSQSPDLPPLPDDFFVEENIPSQRPPDNQALPVEPHADAGFDFDTAELRPERGPIDSDASKLFEPADNKAPQLTTSELNLGVSADYPARTAPVFEKAAPETVHAVDPRMHSEQRAAAVADSELLREFLSGAGIADAHFLPPDQWSTLMRTSGGLLRSMVEGLMRVLRARAELKSQFRVSVTTMRSINNNPLKFTPNVDDAIKLILSPTNPGFLSPEESVREGFNDIMNHQMAMTAGIQAALSEILRSFDPELIEKSQGDGLMFQKKAKCWEYYAEKYPQLKAAAQEEFFGDAFADAYENQMRLLSRSSIKH